MTAYVRVRKLDDLVECIDATGMQVDVAAAAGLSTQRINQIYTGRHSTLEVRKARRLEEALGVPTGHLFVAIDADLLAPYIGADPEDISPVDEVPTAPPAAPAPPAVSSAA